MRTSIIFSIVLLAGVLLVARVDVGESAPRGRRVARLEDLDELVEVRTGDIHGTRAVSARGGVPSAAVVALVGSWRRVHRGDSRCRAARSPRRRPGAAEGAHAVAQRAQRGGARSRGRGLRGEEARASAAARFDLGADRPEGRVAVARVRWSRRNARGV